jgi:hypothetical protein
MANWPTHRARAVQARAFRRHQAKVRKRVRLNATQTASRKPAKAPTEPISDWLWGKVQATSGRR